MTLKARLLFIDTPIKQRLKIFDHYTYSKQKKNIRGGKLKKLPLPFFLFVKVIFHGNISQ